MNRRDALRALAGLGATSVALAADPKGKVWRIGFLYPSTRALAGRGLEAFRKAFRELGYVEGRDYVLDMRFAGNRYGELPALAAELVRSNPDLIIANLAVPALAARQATSTIPIVMVSAGDPVGAGLVTSLARPGGNVTGMSNSLTDIASKHLDLLHEILPGVSRLAVLMNPNYQSHRTALEILTASAPRVGVQVVPAEARAAEEIEDAFTTMAKGNAQALVVLTDAIYVERSRQIAELSMKRKLPSIGYSPEYAEAGFLASYGPNNLHFYRQAAVYADKILKGSRPSDLPVGQPTEFELIINLKTARALRLEIPQSVVLRADRLIE